MRNIKGGTSDVSINIYIIDAIDGTPETGVLWNTAGMDLKYRRESSAVVNITEATLAALTSVHTDGGFLEIGNGVYRLDLPDATIASGAKNVVIFGTVTGMIVLPYDIQLVAYDPDNTTNLGLLALPSATVDAAGGLPISDTGGLDLDSKLANTNEITVARMGVLTDWINGGRLDLLLDAIPTDAMRGTDSAALANVCTEVRLAELDAANLITDVAAIPITAMRGTDNAATEAKQDILDTVADGIQTDLSNATDGLGALKTLIDSVNTDLSNGTDGLGALKTLIDTVNTDLSNGTDGLGALKTLIDTVNTDLSNGTDGLGALKILIDTVDTVVDGLQTDLSNGTDGLGALKTLIDNQLVTALTESYAADGSTATTAQLLYMIWSVLNSLKFVTTTGTSRKLDGATTAMTFTIDDANDPTDINRSS